MRIAFLGRLALLTALSLPYFLSAQLSMEEQDLDQVIPVDLFRDPQKEREERQKQKALHKREREQQRKWRQVAEEIEKRQSNREQWKDQPPPTMGELAEETEESLDDSALKDEISFLTREMDALRLRIRSTRSRAVFFQREARRIHGKDFGERARLRHEARARTRRVQILQSNLEHLEKRREALAGQIEGQR